MVKEMNVQPMWKLSEPQEYKMYPWGDIVFFWENKKGLDRTLSMTLGK